MTQRVVENPWTLGTVRSRFEEWCDRQQLPSDIAHHANHARRYLQAAERRPLPPALLRALADHVAAIERHSGR